MKKYFIGMLTLALVFGMAVIGCSTVSSAPYAYAKPLAAAAPPGTARITQEVLAGVWRSEKGEVYAFRGNTFQSNVLNGGKPGAFEINPILSRTLIVFYKNKNIEGSSLFPGHQFYFEENKVRERDNLDSIFAVLSEDRQTLTLGDKVFSKVGSL